MWGPWHIPGIWGIAVNTFAILYLVVALFWSFWPSTLPVTAANMNYNILIFGGVVLLAAVYYFVIARHTYTGPVVEHTPIDDRAIVGHNTRSFVAEGRSAGFSG